MDSDDAVFDDDGTHDYKYSESGVEDGVIVISSDDDEELAIEEKDIDTTASPIKSSSTKFQYYKDNKCKLIQTIESTDNKYIVPILMNCAKDNQKLISTDVPCGIQENAYLIIDLQSLEMREDILSDDNGAWTQYSCKTKFYLTKKDQERRVTGLKKADKEVDSDIAVRRRYYSNNSCPTYRKTLVTVEYGRSPDMWHPMVFLEYKYDGKVIKFNSLQLGNVLECDQSDLPRNARQMKYLKERNKKEKEPQSRDPLASVMELQKSYLSGFVREISCNDLPTIILFSDQQVDNILKFCCSQKEPVSELGVDLTFQLGPYYLLVTTYRNTLLQVKGSLSSPVFLGPMMICMTKEEQTYLSFVHRLIREVPGLSKYLKAYGTDSEDGLINALSAGFHEASHLLCYIHCKKNVIEKLKKIGVSQSLSSRICSDIFGWNGLLWSNSSEEFDERASKLTKEWDVLETSERNGKPEFSSYFETYKKKDMKNKMSKFAVKSLGVGDDPYTQNSVESINNVIKHWVNFSQQDMDSLVLALFDLVNSFNEEEELAWFGLSDKWEVKEEFEQHRPPPFSNLTPDERKGEISRIRKICQDPSSYKLCKAFKYAPNQPATVSTQKVGVTIPVSSVQPLQQHFSEQELTRMRVTAEGVLNSGNFRQGFKEGTFLVYSGNSVPYVTTILKSGKATCTCTFFGRNNVCCHGLAIAFHKERLQGFLKSYPGRSMNTLTTKSAPKQVGSKKPPPRTRKRHRTQDAVPTSTITQDDGTENVTSTQIDPTTIVIKRNRKPQDPPASSPLVIKRIAGGIRKCAGCGKSLLKCIDGFEEGEDSLYCFGRHEAYSFWNKHTESYQMTSGSRHYHLNAVCTNMHKSNTGAICRGGVMLTKPFEDKLKLRFDLPIRN